MDNKENYIAESSFFNSDVLMVAEFLTMAACVWLIYEGLKLFKFFWGHEQRLSKLLGFEFLTKTLYAVVTFFMGMFLFFDFAEGVKFVVIIRPLFVCLSAFALHQLYKFYKQEL